MCIYIFIYIFLGCIIYSELGFSWDCVYGTLHVFEYKSRQREYLTNCSIYYITYDEAILFVLLTQLMSV